MQKLTEISFKIKGKKIPFKCNGKFNKTELKNKINELLKIEPEYLSYIKIKTINKI